MATRLARSPGWPPAGVMRATAPVTIDAIFPGSAEAGSLIERTRDASVGSVFDACSMSFIARSISRGEPSRRSEFESLSTATVTPPSAALSLAATSAAPAPAVARSGSGGAVWTAANACAMNASFAGSAGGQPGPRMVAGASMPDAGAKVPKAGATPRASPCEPAGAAAPGAGFRPGS